MKTVKKEVEDFLTKYGMYYKLIDRKKALDGFTNEMAQGLLRGKSSSLQMIPSYIYEKNVTRNGPDVVAVDIGGTHVRVAVAHFRPDGVPEIRKIDRYETPGTTVPISREAFFREIARFMKPVIQDIHLVGFCFSFAIHPEKDGDAIVVATGKQLLVTGLVGTRVGECLKTALAEEGFPDIRVVVINDAVAVLLGGVQTIPGRVFDSSVGFIYGTGTNISYFENSENIPGGVPGRKMLVNVEPCGYEGFPRGTIDINFDKTLSDFGVDQYEKMVAGKYQGPLLLKIIKTAADEALFSSDFTTRLEYIKNLSSKELDDFLLSPYGTGVLSSCCCGMGADSERDRMVLYYILDAMIERSALLSAVVLGSVLCRIDAGRNPCRPVFVIAEGSTFYGSRQFRKKLERYVLSFLNEELGVYLEFFSAKDATLVGSAVAAFKYGS